MRRCEGCHRRNRSGDHDGHVRCGGASGAVDDLQAHGIGASCSVGLRFDRGRCVHAGRAIAKAPRIGRDAVIARRTGRVECDSKRGRAGQNIGRDVGPGRGRPGIDGACGCGGETTVVSHREAYRIQNAGAAGRIYLLHRTGRRLLTRGTIAEVPAIEHDPAVIARARGVKSQGHGTGANDPRHIHDSTRRCIRRRGEAAGQFIGANAPIIRIAGEQRIALAATLHLEKIAAGRADRNVDCGAQILDWLVHLHDVAGGIPKRQFKVGIGAKRCGFHRDIKNARPRIEIEHIRIVC